jgi:hypothetical protein
VISPAEFIYCVKRFKAELENRRPKSAKRPLPRGLPEDLWNKTLSQIPSLFGRIVYLASLRNANSGKYEHHGLAAIYGEEESDRVLRESHESAFRQWLNHGVERQKVDLEEYLTSLGGDRKVLVENWIRLSPYKAVVPTMSRPFERELYTADLESLLWLLRNEYGVDAPIPGA